MSRGRSDQERAVDAARYWLGVALTAESEVEAVDAFLAARRSCRELGRAFPVTEEDTVQAARIDLDRELGRERPTTNGRRVPLLAMGSCVPVPIEPEFAGPHQTEPHLAPIEVPAQGYNVRAWED